MGANDLTIGCIFIGVVLNVWLYGFSCVQAYIYYSRFKEDKPSMRAFVALLFTADSINTVLDIVFLYKYVVSNFGDAVYNSRANNEFATDPILVSMIGFLTQLFFAWRVWKLTNSRFSWLAPLTIVVVGFLSFISAIGSTVGVVIVREFAQFQKFQSAVIIWLAGAAIADAIITISLIVTLHKARTGFSQTDDIISKLIRGTLQTGLLTASFAIIDLILFLASPTTLHLVFNLPLAKLYVNSLLSTLNARAFANNTRYTMHSSALRHEGGNNHLSRQESGAIQSTVSAKGFTPISSNSGSTAINEIKPKAIVKKNYFSNRGGTRSQEAKADGIHILTIEERFESTLPENGPQLLPYTMGRGPRTPGESRKSSDDELSDNFNITQESLAMTAVPTSRERAMDNATPTPPPVTIAGNHPYQNY
ncbi:hypothetical protein CBS101457_002562 [Exobasidium rhododendri]|nr:hypothetical protein CBS101457_002562 [Exobasidium rhododendri]